MQKAVYHIHFKKKWYTGFKEMVWAGISPSLYKANKALFVYVIHSFPFWLSRYLFYGIFFMVKACKISTNEYRRWMTNKQTAVTLRMNLKLVNQPVKTRHSSKQVLLTVVTSFMAFSCSSLMFSTKNADTPTEDICKNTEETTFTYGESANQWKKQTRAKFTKKKLTPVTLGPGLQTFSDNALLWMCGRCDTSINGRTLCQGGGA